MWRVRGGGRGGEDSQQFGGEQGGSETREIEDPKKLRKSTIYSFLLTIQQSLKISEIICETPALLT